MFSLGWNPAYYFLKADNDESFWSWSWSKIGLKARHLVNHFKYGKYEQIYVFCKFAQIYLNNPPQKTKSSISDLRSVVAALYCLL